MNTLLSLNLTARSGSLVSAAECTTAITHARPEQQFAGGSSTMPLNLGDPFPNLDLKTTDGDFKYYDYLTINDEPCWGILFSHPADFTPVCTTELGVVANMLPKFSARNVKVIGLSCSSIKSHTDWIEDIKYFSKCQAFGYPIISDPARETAIKLGMLDPEEKDKAGLPLTCRALCPYEHKSATRHCAWKILCKEEKDQDLSAIALVTGKVFIVGPDRKLKLSLLYPATTGRNFDEILRVIDSLQLTADRKVATPANWKTGSDCMILPNISNDDAKRMFPGFKVANVPSGKGYIRTTTQPF